MKNISKEIATGIDNLIGLETEAKIDQQPWRNPVYTSIFNGVESLATSLTKTIGRCNTWNYNGRIK